MKKIAFFGGTGGLGQATIPHLNVDRIINPVGSLSVDFTRENDIENYFFRNPDTDVVVIFSNYNYNSFLHKYDFIDGKLEEQINTNILGVTKCITSALRVMRTNGYGRIVLASSITVDKNVMGTSVYAAAKAYYENLVKTIAIENANKGITANCIQLGYMDGGLTYTLPEDFIQKTIKNIPSQRLGTGKEIAQTIDFLIENEYINGTTIKLTGGL
mgnify:FL=1